MQITQKYTVNVLNKTNNLAFASNKEARVNNDEQADYFEAHRAKVQKLPDNKAIKVGSRPGIGLLNVLLLPFGFLGFSVKTHYSLVDIDKNNLSDKEKKQIRKGKLIDYVPAGYEIKNDKVVKAK